MNIIEKAVEKLEKELEAELEEAGASEKAQPRQRTNGAAPAVERQVPHDGASGMPAAAVHGGAAEASPARAPVSRSVHLDLERLNTLGFITPEHAHSLIAEEHRLLKRPVLRRATPGDPEYLQGGNLVMLASALPGEGKTFVSVNLAMSIAMEVDRTVLLVDSDVAKSDVSRLLGLTGEKGLSDYLVGEERDLSKLLLRTNVEKLSVLPSGPHYAKMTELLASEQMGRLVKELSARYPDRIVIFDSPPLLATSGASVLSSLMGQVLMVVEAVRTPQRAVQESLRRIEAAGSHNVTMVLNKQRGGPGRGYAYYGYGYGYGYGYDRHDQAPREPR